MHTKPTHAIQVIRPRVRILASENPTAKAMARKTAVHVPCVETAFKAIERLSIPDPETNTQSTLLEPLPNLI